MEQIELIMLIGCIVIFILWCSWIIEYGILRATLSILFRVLWLLPLFLALFPIIRTIDMSESLTLKTIHILLDDSDSMKNTKMDNSDTLLSLGEKTIESLSLKCQKYGCLVKATRLSELTSLTKLGFTPLSLTLPTFLYGVGDDPWIIISDGGDYRPQLEWSEGLQGAGKKADGQSRGLIIGFKPKHHTNLWIKTSDKPSFLFAEKPSFINVILEREKEKLDKETVQVHLSIQGKIIAVENAKFAASERSIELELKVPPLAKGRHLFTIKALPTGDETIFWDNTTYATVEVLPNTVGILHLLGAPSWDGRFLRRYLKSEPKYDLISFFILRDPYDIQLVDERELSLIPFPVDRLFTQELPNFHLVILQNFTLSRFLDPTYQKNLVKFVKNGGGLLFIGGPRALNHQDFENSPLASILPFEISGSPYSQYQSSPFATSYDGNMRFQMEFATPTNPQRSLANVYDEWKELGADLLDQSLLQGIHKLGEISFKEGRYTPLINARRADGKTTPLVVASYPEKGRALWIFSDSLYRMAFSQNRSSSSKIYKDFFSRAITWLLRQEIRQPLFIRNFAIESGEENGFTNWAFDLVGPSASYFQLDGNWEISICGVKIQQKSVVTERIWSQNLRLQGSMERSFLPNTWCDAVVTGKNTAFGSVRARATKVIPTNLKDSDVYIAPKKITQLAERTAAKLEFSDNSNSKAIDKFLAAITGATDNAPILKSQVVKDYYWILDHPLFFLLLIFLPLEVLLRRWKQLTLMKNPK